MKSTTGSAMAKKSFPSSSTKAAVHQNMTKLVGPPYRKRSKNAVLSDPSLEHVMGSKEKALDVRLCIL